ncbi:glycosyltransferase family 4 protein [Desulfotignum phosphitoxidans]|uniref:Protein-disulfide isomerase n=1 Tax=Desulfotignum phosphitoxidans DSM 13687 TaxID=1286635 RepID=S0G514_9BACT|nr:glycosyltransferase family 4 protein [Desulfotignum phosphitoxidans]EMS80854.1 protein-disulfide isomerase [Desulfotignum phosphitoxidans DSM 13687]
MIMTVSMLGTLPPQKALSPYCLGLVTALDAAGVRLFFYSFSNLYPAWLHPSKEALEDPTFKKIDTRNLTVSTLLTWYNPLSWIKAGMTMKTDVFHAQWWSLPTLPAVISMIYLAKRKKIPVIVTVHNVMPHEGSVLFDWASRLIFQLADHLIVHTKHNKKTLICQYQIHANLISVIPHGPLTVFKTGIQNFRQHRQISEKEKIVLFFGTIRRYKGLDILIHALSKVKKTLPARLVIAGSLWEPWDRYENLIRHLSLADDVIKLIGYVPSDQVGALFSAADLVVLPYTHFDSQSGVGAAAIAFHVPMIVTDTGGLPDLVADPECVVPCSDSNLLAEKIVNVLSNETLQKKLKNDARKIEKMMSWERIADQTLSLYHQVLDDRR